MRMTRGTGRSILALVMACMWVRAGGEDAAQPPGPMRLAFDLVDGSRLVGVLGRESVPFQTPYANMDIPLKRILAITMGDDHTTATLDFQDGDKITGVLGLSPISVETAFGHVEIGARHLRRIQVISSATAWPETLRKGLLLHYVFDRDTRGAVTDRSGRECNGKASGASWTADSAMEGALEFKGGNERVDFPAAGLPAGKSPRTMAVWVLQENTTSRYYVVGYGGDPSGTEFRISLNEFTPGQFSLETGMGGWHSAAVLMERRWYHLAVTYGESGVPAFYVNGKAVEGAGTWLGARVNTVAGGGTLGMRGSNEGGGYLVGRIAEAAVWERKIGADEVQQHFRLRAAASGARGE